MIAAHRAFADLTVYPIEEILGRNRRFLQGLQTDPVSSPRIRACLDAGQGCIEWIVNDRRDGSQFYNPLLISPIHDTDGNELFFFGNQLDITLGSPTWLSEVSFGAGHIVPALEEEFPTTPKQVTVAAQTQRIIKSCAPLDGSVANFGVVRRDGGPVAEEPKMQFSRVRPDEATSDLSLVSLSKVLFSDDR